MKKYFVVIVVLVVLLLGQKNLLTRVYKSEKNIGNSNIEIENKDEVNNKPEINNKIPEKVVNNNDKYPNVNKLMIVAHPDDESYWGGAHLIEDDYLVVCVTCGTVPIRVKEFKNAMSLTNDEYLMLGYPDRTNGKKDDWSKVYTSIMNKLEEIINIKKWNQIVTHNPEGEYGHIHHMMLNKMVTELSDSDVLWYFGRYYNKQNINSISNIPKINSKTKKIKEQKLIPIYKSQKNAENMFKHMFDYENFVFNKNWNVNL